MSKYRRIKYEDRCQIYALSKRGTRQENIAQRFGRQSKRGEPADLPQSWSARLSVQASGSQGSSTTGDTQKKPRKLTVLMRSKIEAKLRQMRWSPEQISGWLSEQGIKLSHERIYQMIWDDKRDGGNLWRSLRRRGKRYNKRAGKNAGRGLIPNRIDISERPAIVARKTRLGRLGGRHRRQRRTQRRLAHAGPSAKPNYPKSSWLPRATARATQKAAVRRLKPIGHFVHHHHLRQRKGLCRASGHRPCAESQNLLRHAVSRMGARFE